MEHYYEVKFVTGDCLYIKTRSDLQGILWFIESKAIVSVEVLVNSHDVRDTLINMEYIVYVTERKDNPHLCIK